MIDVHVRDTYIVNVIKRFRDKRTVALFQGLTPNGIGADVVRRAKAKLDLLDAAATLGFLRSPPGNRLEALKGGRLGQYAIRVNDQWRLCFVWQDGDVYDAEFCDYH